MEDKATQTEDIARTVQAWAIPYRSLWSPLNQSPPLSLQTRDAWGHNSVTLSGPPLRKVCLRQAEFPTGRDTQTVLGLESWPLNIHCLSTDHSKEKSHFSHLVIQTEVEIRAPQYNGAWALKFHGVPAICMQRLALHSPPYSQLFVFKEDLRSAVDNFTLLRALSLKQTHPNGHADVKYQTV